MSIRVATFNILAPCWASADYYPESSLPYLDRKARRSAIIDVLKLLAIDNDFIALQETQKDEIAFFETVLEELGFEGYNSTHDDDYWAKQVRPDVEFVPNGVALYWNVSCITMTSIGRAALAEVGNHCVIGTFRKGEKQIRVASVHLDSENQRKRLKEMRSLLGRFLPVMPKVIDVIAGDFNYSPNLNGNQEEEDDPLFKGKFVNVLESLHLQEEDKTYLSAHTSKSVDHIMVRNANPVEGQVLTFKVLEDGEDAEDRLNLLLQRVGSDHFPVEAAFK